MIYNPNTFIRPLITNDKFLKIYDTLGNLAHSINPHSIKNRNVYSNTIIISLDYKVIKLNFNSNDDAKLGLGKIQETLDILINREPAYIEKDIQVFASNNFVGVTSSAATDNYVHTQAIASATWSVTHGLNKKCNVNVTDLTDREMIGEVQYVSLNEVVILFNNPKSGYVYCN